MNAQDLAPVALGHDLHHPALTDDVGLREQRQIELLHDHVVASILCLGLRVADRGDLGLGEGHARDARVVDLGHVEAGDALGHADAFQERRVRELQRRRRDVADRPHVGRARLQLAVDLHVATVQGDAGLGVADAFGVRSAPDGDQADVRPNRLRIPALGLVGDLHVITRVLDVGHLHARDRRDPTLLERPGGLPGDVLVLERRDPWQGLQDGHLRPERAVDRGELQADRARPDHHGRRRHAVVDEGLVARDDPLGHRQTVKEPRKRARGEHQVGARQLAAIHIDGRGPHVALPQVAGPADDVDLARLDEPGEPRDLLLHDVTLGLEHLGPVDLAARPDTPLLGSVDVVHDRRRLEEGL